jgi:hypothetical protein
VVKHPFLIALLLVSSAFCATETPDPVNYIPWNSGRKLTIDDFKAPTRGKPFEAETNSIIKYEYQGSTNEGRVVIKVNAFFYTRKSYFKAEKNRDQVLEHEQGHFDITEWYARKLTKAFKDYAPTVGILQQQENRIYNQITREWKKTQARIRREIAALEEYANKEIVVPI